MPLVRTRILQNLHGTTQLYICGTDRYQAISGGVNFSSIVYQSNECRLRLLHLLQPYESLKHCLFWISQEVLSVKG